MRTSERIGIVVVLGVTAFVAASALAFDGTPPNSPEAALPVVAAPTGIAVIKKPVPPADIPNVPAVSSLTALQYAADGGHPIAQWKLGRMYASGDGVAQDDLRAFDYFSKVANAHADDNPAAPQASVVANAFVALGRYYKTGIPNSRVKADPERAREMFAYAASYFGNAEAQFNLARLYLDGVGMPRDPKHGVRWLALSAQKGQHEAQAMLGQMMFNGDRLQRQAARGLMWMALAQEGATADEAWIKDNYQAALGKASLDDKAMAAEMLERWVQGRRD
ncbi:MAG: sel1 repeat family protein [Afipia sp.]|nr:sel1 repeat family protein [Afipia sp.]